MTADGFTPGAQVATGHGPETRLGVVDRTTPTQILVQFYAGRDSVRYRKDDRRQVGAGTWDRHVYLRPATEEDRLEVRWRRVRRLAHQLARGRPEQDRRQIALTLREHLESYLARTDPQETR